MCSQSLGGKSAILPLHGFPSSPCSFRNDPGAVQNLLRDRARPVGLWSIGPHLDATFTRVTDLMEELLERLGAAKANLHVHDFRSPGRARPCNTRSTACRGLIVQNANDHRTGFEPQ